MKTLLLLLTLGACAPQLKPLPERVAPGYAPAYPSLGYAPAYPPLDHLGVDK